MKKIAILTASLVAAAAMADAAVVLFVTFDAVSTQTDVADYAPLASGSDVIPTTGFIRAGTPSNVDQDPHPAAGPGRPDVVTNPPAGGFQGGGAMFTTNASSVSGSGNDQAGEGFYVALDTPLTGSFTAEAIVYVTGLNPLNCEFGIQNFFGTDGLGGSGTPQQFVPRIIGGSLLSPDNQLQLMTQQAANAEQNVLSGSPFVANAWTHVAVTYDSGLNQAKLYVDGVQIGGDVTPDWAGAGGFQMDDLALGYYANGAGSNRSLEGYMDAFALDNTALAPGTFNLPLQPVSSAERSWNMYE